MKIGVISDTHGSITAWQRVMAEYFAEVDLIIHCGDLLYHGPRNPLPEGYAPADLAQAINSTTIPIICAKGNCDAEVDQMLLQIPIQAPFAQVFTPVWKMMVHHGHTFAANALPPWTTTYNLIISGHTHLPGIVKTGSQIYLNPGSPALPKNTEQTASVATINDHTIALWDIQAGQLMQQFTLS